jgi:hypothetical protein
MAIKNYTTKVPALQSVQKIEDSLIKHGACGIQKMYGDDKRISALSFALPFKDGKNITFSLPCEWRKFQQVLIDQNIPRANDDEYAYRVAWANLRDWVLAQMALYETQIVTMPQVFLPFAHGQNGKTLYEQIIDGRFLLGNGE